MQEIKPFFIILIAGIIGISCINEYRTKLDGEIYYADIGPGFLPYADKTDSSILRADANLLLADYQKSGSLEKYSDYAVNLIFLGEYEKAKNIYFEIENRSPNLYTTASNLGTIYELIGALDSALFWIKKSVELNPDSHDGSEWIHIKILEFQISKKTDYSASLLGLDFGDEALPKNIENIDLENIEDQIYHQLEERLQFIEPKNLIVGNIYFDLGNIYALTKNVEAAIECYDEANKFGFESELMNIRRNEFVKIADGIDEKINKLQNSHIKVKKKLEKISIIMWLVIISLGSILIFIVLIITYLKLKKRKTIKN